MRPPSLYWYFDSKQAIYDAMFAQGNRQLLERLTSPGLAHRSASDPALRAPGSSSSSAWRTWSAISCFSSGRIPDFQPSPEAYAVAVQVLDQMRARLALAGVSDPEHFDMWTALVAGLSAQQTANDPGGDRWLRLVDEAVDMYADHIMTRQQREATT